MIKRADSQYLNMPKLANMTMTAVFLYILALIMPITGFLLPAYKIKSINTMKKNGWLILNITIPLAILVVIGILDTLMGIQFTKIKALGVYFMVFFPIELLYYFFVKIKFFVNIFDRIIITGILISLGVFLYIQNAGPEMEFIKKSLEEIYMEKYNIDSNSLALIFKMMKENAMYIIYTYLGAVVYLTYFMVKRSTYSNWKISYQWLLFYIVPFLIMRFTDIKNIWLINIMEITKISFIVYGVKIVYNLISKKIKIDTVSQILSVMIGFLFPNILFAIGGLQCFEFMKIKVIKIDNGGR